MKYFTAIILLIALTGIVPAQTQTQTPPTPVVTTTVNVPPIATTVTMPVPNVKVAPFPSDKVFVESSLPGARKVVKDKPFSAEGISESVQTLEDGNRIRRSVTTKMYRDGEGRFRRETTASTGGSGYFYSTGGGGLTMFGGGDSVSIFDPVANVSYSLNPTERTARSFSLQVIPGKGVYTATIDPKIKAQIETRIAETKKQAEKDKDKDKEKSDRDKKSITPPTFIYGTGNSIGVGVGMGIAGGGVFFDEKNSKTEQLGTKMLEGVEVEGTKTVTTIEAGKIGNEREIEITYERWYSKDLDMIVYSRHYDPRFGEQTYKLVNIDRSEPDRSLFTVPADYKIEQSKGFTVLSPATPVTTKQQ